MTSATRMCYFCCDEERRGRVLALNRDRARPRITGIDFIEVSREQTGLDVYLLGPVPAGTSVEHLRVEVRGGDRIAEVGVNEVRLDPTDLRRLVVTLERPGDFSVYTLQLRGHLGPAGRQSIPFDPLLGAVDFSFKVDCPSELDCKDERPCPTELPPEPEIDYLAKDYASFRRLMLDRMAAIAPQWTERNAADLGVTLVELLAYVGDMLSYRQDAVGNEAYLGTARSRISVRRHVRLVDYPMHEGCNARAWVQIEVEGAPLDIERGTPLLTRLPEAQARIAPERAERFLNMADELFEVLDEDRRLHPRLNRMSFHTWGDRRCCLPRGATSATLHGAYPELQAGDVLVLIETRGVRSGDPADADPERRHPVRVMEAFVTVNPLGGPEDDPRPQDVTEIHWAEEDALPFALVVSTNVEVAAALGNIVLVDHGQRRTESLGTVPSSTLVRVPEFTSDRCNPEEPAPIPARFSPTLSGAPLTFRDPYDAALPAACAMQRRPDEALPVDLELVSQVDESTTHWKPQRDLLSSAPNAPDFVAEIEHDGSAQLRFGDGVFGRRAPERSRFEARYRVGNGRQGNVGAGAIGHIVHPSSGISRVWNPLPARGGMEAESVAQVRRFAPHAYRRQERAVTPADYAAVAERHPEVQRAIAALRWTGSWHTVFVTVDRRGGLPIDPAFEDELTNFLRRYRMTGHDVEIEAPRFVDLEIALRAELEAGFSRSDVQRAIAAELRSLFHPDRYTFGQAVYASPLYAAVQDLAGVVTVIVTRFRRFGRDDGDAALDSGMIALGKNEIARLDNDPNFPQRGTLTIELEGGR